MVENAVYALGELGDRVMKVIFEGNCAASDMHGRLNWGELEPVLWQ